MEENKKRILSEKRASAGRQGGLAPHKCRGRGCEKKKVEAEQVQENHISQSPTSQTTTAVPFSEKQQHLK